MEKMITTTFAERLSSDSFKLLRAADSIRQLHGQVQQCEAGAPIDRKSIFRICFRFLGLMGFFPERVDGFPVKSIGLMEDYGLYFDLDYSVERDESTLGNGWDQGCGLMGPFRIIPLPTLNQIRTMLKEAFPKSSLTTIMDADGLYHVTVREKYLPADGAVSPIGAATCSNRRIAVIQAIVRLMHAIVQEKLAAKQKTLQKHSTLAYLYSGNPSKTLAMHKQNISDTLKEIANIWKQQDRPTSLDVYARYARYQAAYPDIIKLMKEAQDQLLKQQDRAMTKTPFRSRTGRSAPFGARY